MKKNERNLKTNPKRGKIENASITVQRAGCGDNRRICEIYTPTESVYETVLCVFDYFLTEIIFINICLHIYYYIMHYVTEYEYVFSAHLIMLFYNSYLKLSI